MGGNDLNTKKSWHPSLQKNQARVWKEEKNALAERQLIEKLRKEREEERQVEELQRLQEASGGKIATKRVEWMYSGPSGDGAGVTEEREAYLLGKRRIDNLLKDDTQALQKGAAVGIDAVGQPSANLVRDTQKKILEDPLLAIQKQTMEMQIKAAKAAQKAKQYEEKRAKEKDRERRHKHRHHHSRRDRSRSASDDYDERERRHHRSRRDDKDDRHRRRSRSPRRDDRPSRDSRDNYRQRSRSRSPYRKSHRDDYRKRSRSRSPRRRDHDNDDRDNHRRRDRSPARRSHDRHEDYHRRPRRPSPPPTKEAAPAGPSAAERLAAMQADASSLEDQRLERLRQLEQDVAAEEEKRRKDKDGKERFLSGVRNKAAGMDLGEAIARGRQGLTKEVDV